MPHGVPSTSAKCCNCNSVAAKCVRCHCGIAKRACINCAAPNCVRKINLEPRSQTTREDETGYRAIQQHSCTGENETGGAPSNDLSQNCLSIDNLYDNVVQWISIY
ncbi:hypothetical protein GJ496_003625 [Pomphorhynchus laevis]|nr:hypothetical protein GJ496_003625 [Pomphorhynchus laevis]